MPSSRLRRAAVLAAVTLSLILSGARPAAAVPAVVRPSSRPWFFTFGLGPAIRIDDFPTQLKLEQAIGYHFFGRGDGPALGAAISEGFGNHHFTFGLGLRFWWDIQPVSNLGLYLAPFVHFGFALISWDCRRNEDCSEGYFDMQFGFEPRLVLGDRGMIFFRVVGLNPLLGDNVGFRYDLLFGGGVTF